MRGKKTSPQLSERIESIVETEEPVGLDRLTIKISLKDITLQERVHEASKPLYLRRYE